MDTRIEMTEKLLCPLCEEGHATLHYAQTEVEYAGQKGVIETQLRRCDVCESELVGDVEGRANKRAMIAFRKTVDGLLPGEEIRAIREKYRLTQTQAAQLFGGGPVAFSKYENDDVAHSEAMNNLLRLVRRREEAFWELVEEKQLGELLSRRPARVAHYPASVISHVILTMRMDKPMPTQSAGQLSYLTLPHTTQLGTPQWMQ